MFCVFTFAGAFIRLQLHEVRAGAGEGLVEVDETKVGAWAAGAWVRSWKEAHTHTHTHTFLKKRNQEAFHLWELQFKFNSAVVHLLKHPCSEGNIIKGAETWSLLETLTG